MEVLRSVFASHLSHKVLTSRVQFTASTAHLRGLIHLHLGASDLAKDAFVEALSRDVKCFESFEILVGGEMMTSEEGQSSILSVVASADLERDRMGVYPRTRISSANWGRCRFRQDDVHRPSEEGQLITPLFSVSADYI